MLGMDAAWARYWRSHGGGPGMGFPLKEFTARPQAAVRRADLHRIPVYHTPR
jgi:hypothetical protein